MKKKYYVTCIVVKESEEMIFRNDIIEHDPLTSKNVIEFQEKIKQIIFRRERQSSGNKIINVVGSAFSVLGD